eukprot:TRINITY_DN33131_c0_g1_i1.p1 TRINITY_DN33131_c0_g1~~TRINITY_DN33131_c0_g1_i1.p1  ORF type:complete len:662 (+),score=265.16 TRINITY_DN33131_c0_g1_i1:137-2122(+)
MADGDPYSQIQFLQNQVAQLTKELQRAELRGSVQEACLDGGEDNVVGKISAQGFLKKKGGGAVFGKDFERRWFILTPTHFRYFEEKGAIEVDKKLKIEEKSDDPTAFFITHPNLGRKMEMKCTTKKGRERWCSALKGKPLPAPGFETKQRANLEKEYDAQRQVLEGMHQQQLDMMRSMMAGEMRLTQREVKAKEIARRAAEELRASDERHEEATKDILAEKASLEVDKEALQGQLDKETARKVRSQMEAAVALVGKTDASLLALYKAKWCAWVLYKRKRQHARDMEKAEQEHASLTGQLIQAQDHGERFMTAHGVVKRALVDVSYDLARLGDELYYQELFMHYQREEMKARFSVRIQELQKQTAQLTLERDTLRAGLKDTSEMLEDTTEKLHVTTDRFNASMLELDELLARARLESEFHTAAFAMMGQSVRASTAQVQGGRVMASMSGWDRNGGHPWRRVYMWADGQCGTLNYSHRDLRWGEIESIDLTKVTSVEVEGFWEAAPPPGIKGSEHLGFYIEMNSGLKHRFCADTVAERSEWLDGLRGLVLTVCYPKPQTHTTVVGNGTPIPPLPAHPGQHWGHTEGGGVPAAAAASHVHGLRSASPRKSRAAVTQASPTTPGTFTSPRRVDLDAQHPRHSKVTLLPHDYKHQAPYETPTNFFR